MKRKVYLDVDTGVDDSLALLLAISAPDIDVEGITCVAGNVPIDTVVRNTLDVISFGGRSDIPVARGMQTPLLEQMVNASQIHGENGLGDIKLPISQSEIVDEHAVEFLRKEITSSADRVTIFALGPLTNIATLIRKHPEVSLNIEEIVVMGGAVGAGNVTPTSEFNIRQDPEAADIVFSADIPVLLYTWDVFVRVAFDRFEIESLAKSDNHRVSLSGRLLLSMLDRFGDLDNAHNAKLGNQTSIGDAGAVACVLNPDAIVVKELPIAVELNGKYTRGQTVIDQRPPEMAALEEGGLEIDIQNTVRVVVDLDVDSMKQTFVNNLKYE